MRLISTKVLQEGMIVGRAIWNDANMPLLQEGVKVTTAIINRLNALNIQYIYIDDAISKGIEIEETVPLKVRQKAIDQISKSFKKLKNKNGVDLTHTLESSTREFSSIIDGLMEYLLGNKEIVTLLSDAFIYDEYIYQHSLQVTIYSIKIAQKLNYNVNEIRQIAIGAILHDVGKMAIEQDVLAKPGRLTAQEFELMKQHTQVGFDTLRNLHTISLLSAHCAYQHHERLDGSGYPRGLVDFEIHPYAKIIAVADVFDAVTSKRVYRDKMLPSDGMQIINEGKGTLYDEEVVNAFQKCIALYPNGTVVKLTDSRRGIVFKQNNEDPNRPSIRIFEENNQLIKATYELNLQNELDLEIEKIELNYLSQSTINQ